jgi:hypothetical protein
MAGEISIGANVGINIGCGIEVDNDGDDWLLLTMSIRPKAPLRLPIPPAYLKTEQRDDR